MFKRTEVAFNFAVYICRAYMVSAASDTKYEPHPNVAFFGPSVVYHDAHYPFWQICIIIKYTFNLGYYISDVSDLYKLLIFVLSITFTWIKNYFQTESKWCSNTQWMRQPLCFQKHWPVHSESPVPIYTWVSWFSHGKLHSIFVFKRAAIEKDTKHVMQCQISCDSKESVQFSSKFGKMSTVRLRQGCTVKAQLFVVNLCFISSLRGAFGVPYRTLSHAEIATR